MHTEINGYRIVKEIGIGGMGRVYKAIHPSLNINVIIKELSLAGKEMEERFEREAAILMTLRHDNIVSVFDYFIADGKRYLVMEYIDGVTLAVVIGKKKKLKPLAAILLFNEISRGLAYAHSKQVVHRDLKPQNILISRAGEVRIIDFGIASCENLPETECTRPDLTGEGLIIGTAAYMSPEQLTDARDTTAQSDIYSMGVILYEMMTGDTPFGRGLTAESMAARLKKESLGDAINEVPALFRPVIKSCLRYDPRKRYKTIAAPLRKLERSVRRLSADEVKENISGYLFSGAFAQSIDKARPVYSSLLGSFRESRTRRFAAIASAAILVISLGGCLFAFTSLRYRVFMGNSVGKMEVRYIFTLPYSIIDHPRMRLPDKKLYLAQYQKKVPVIKDALYKHVDEKYRSHLYRFQIRAVLERQEMREGIINVLGSEEIILRPVNYIVQKGEGFTIDLGDATELEPKLIFSSGTQYRTAGRYLLRISLNNQSYCSQFNLPSLKESAGPLVVETLDRETPQRRVSFTFDIVDDVTLTPINDVKKYIKGGVLRRWSSWEKNFDKNQKNQDLLLNNNIYFFCFMHPDYDNDCARVVAGRDQNVVYLTIRLRAKSGSSKSAAPVIRK